MVKARVSGVPYLVDLPDEPEKVSPCVNICDFDWERKICKTCLRNQDDLRRWSSMTPQQRKDRMLELKMLRLSQF